MEAGAGGAAQLSPANGQAEQGGTLVSGHGRVRSTSIQGTRTGRGAPDWPPRPTPIPYDVDCIAAPPAHTLSWPSRCPLCHCATPAPLVMAASFLLLARPCDRHHRQHGQIAQILIAASRTTQTSPCDHRLLLPAPQRLLPCAVQCPGPGPLQLPLDAVSHIRRLCHPSCHSHRAILLPRDYQPPAQI